MEDSRRKFTSGHRTVGGEQEDRSNHGRSDVLHEKQKHERRNGRRVWEWTDGT